MRNQRNLTSLRRATEVTVTIGENTGTTREAGETSLSTQYAKTTGIKTDLILARDNFTQVNFGREDRKVYVGAFDPEVDIDKGYVIKVTASEHGPAPAVGDHFVVIGMSSPRGLYKWAEMEFHPDFTANNELG